MIRQATLKDCHVLYALEQEIFSNDPFALSKASFGYHLKNNTVYIFEIDNEPAGYILWLKRKKYFRLYSLAVSKRFQKQGVAQKLLAYSFEQLKEKSFSLEVKISNESGIRLYEKFGFRIKKVLPNYYEKEDGYWMILSNEVSK